MKEITLRPIDDEDIMLLTSWLNKEYILKWYHEPDEWLTEIKDRNGSYLWIHHFIVMDETTPIGFCQYQPDKENLPSNHVLLSNGYIFDKQKDYYYKVLD